MRLFWVKFRPVIYEKNVAKSKLLKYAGGQTRDVRTNGRQTSCDHKSLYSAYGSDELNKKL